MADYTTLENVKNRLNIESGDAPDDEYLEHLISAASAYIAGATSQEFVSASGTRYFDTPFGPELVVDDFTSLTSITNGDGTAIANTDVTTLPANKTPKYVIRIKASSTAYWCANAAGDTIAVIAIVSNWGYSTAAPADVREAVEDIVTNKYKSRHGVGAEGAATITGAGVVITPRDITPFARSVIERYKRIV
jgi:hypothetical protein